MRQAEGEEGAPSCIRAPSVRTAKLGCERVGQLLIIKLTGRINYAVYVRRTSNSASQY
jgi:hypothetical protein